MFAALHQNCILEENEDDTGQKNLFINYEFASI